MPSDTEKLRRWLLDIHDHTAKAELFVAGLAYEAFESDEMRVYAVTRCLDIVSEASRRLPEHFKAQHNSIKWREMAAAGNIYRHEYDNVAARRVWVTLTQSLPALRAVSAAALANLS